MLDAREKAPPPSPSPQHAVLDLSCRAAFNSLSLSLSLSLICASKKTTPSQLIFPIFAWSLVLFHDSSRFRPSAVGLDQDADAVHQKIVSAGSDVLVSRRTMSRIARGGGRGM